MFSILLVLFAIIGLSLLFFLVLLLISTPKKSGSFGNNDQSVEIVKVVEAHRKILPICSAQGWCLVSSSHSLRCWKKDFSFLVMGSPVTIYGCTKQINCSAVIVLNVIADISTWPEWDVWAEGQTVHLEVAEDPALHGDHYMQCDQLVLTTTVLQTKPDVVMYRFGNLESNGVGWILLWNAKRLEWTFYLAQPIDLCYDDDEAEYSLEKCALTAISGSEDTRYGDSTMPDKLCAKIQNLSDAICCSYMKLRPFQSLIKCSTSTLNNPHFPTIHSALNDLPEKPCVLLKVEQLYNQFQNSVLAVLPTAWEKSGRIAEFQLISHLLKKDSINGIPIKDIALDEKRRSRRRHKLRSDSVTTNSPIIQHLQTEARRSSSLSSPRKKPPELTVTAAAEDTSEIPVKVAAPSFLNLIFHRRRSSDGSSERKSKIMPKSCSSTPPRERKKRGGISSSSSSQEDLTSHRALLAQNFINANKEVTNPAVNDSENDLSMPERNE